MADLDNALGGSSGVSSSLGGSSDLNNILGSAASNYDKATKQKLQEQKQLQDKTQEVSGEIKGYDKALSELKPPEMKELPKAPDLDPKSDPRKAWGSIAMMFAVFGSALTRQPASTALNAAAGVMDAYKKNDLDAADRKFKEWQANTENAIKLHNFQMETYKAAFDKIKEGKAGAKAELQAYAAAFKDDNTLTMLQRPVSDLIHHMDSMDKLGKQMEMQTQRLEQMNSQYRGNLEEKYHRDEITRQNAIDRSQVSKENVQSKEDLLKLQTELKEHLLKEQSQAKETLLGEQMRLADEKFRTAHEGAMAREDVEKLRLEGQKESQQSRLEYLHEQVLSKKEELAGKAELTAEDRRQKAALAKELNQQKEELLQATQAAKKDLLASQTAAKEQTLEESTAAKRELLGASTEAKKDILGESTAAKEDYLKQQTAARKGVLQQQTQSKQDILSAQTNAKEQMLGEETQAKEGLLGEQTQAKKAIIGLQSQSLLQRYNQQKGLIEQQTAAKQDVLQSQTAAKEQLIHDNAEAKVDQLKVGTEAKEGLEAQSFQDKMRLAGENNSAAIDRVRERKDFLMDQQRAREQLLKEQNLAKAQFLSLQAQERTASTQDKAALQRQQSKDREDFIAKQTSAREGLLREQTQDHEKYLKQHAEQHEADMQERANKQYLGRSRTNPLTNAKVQVYQELSAAHESGDPQRIAKAEQDAADLKLAEGKSVAASGDPTKDLNGARQLYNTMYPVNAAGRRVDPTGQPAPDFGDFYNNKWTPLRKGPDGLPPASKPVQMPGDNSGSAPPTTQAPVSADQGWLGRTKEFFTGADWNKPTGGTPSHSPTAASPNKIQPGEKVARDASGNKYVVRNGQWVKAQE